MELCSKEGFIAPSFTSNPYLPPVWHFSVHALVNNEFLSAMLQVGAVTAALIWHYNNQSELMGYEKSKKGLCLSL